MSCETTVASFLRQSMISAMEETLKPKSRLMNRISATPSGSSSASPGSTTDKKFQARHLGRKQCDRKNRIYQESLEKSREKCRQLLRSWSFSKTSPCLIAPKSKLFWLSSWTGSGTAELNGRMRDSCCSQENMKVVHSMNPRFIVKIDYRTYLLAYSLTTYDRSVSMYIAKVAE